MIIQPNQRHSLWTHGIRQIIRVLRNHATYRQPPITLPPTSANHNALERAKYTLHQHLSSSCEKWPCYTELTTTPSQLIVLVKQPIDGKPDSH